MKLTEAQKKFNFLSREGISDKCLTQNGVVLYFSNTKLPFSMEDLSSDDWVEYNPKFELLVSMECDESKPGFIKLYKNTYIIRDWTMVDNLDVDDIKTVIPCEYYNRGSYDINVLSTFPNLTKIVIPNAYKKLVPINLYKDCKKLKIVDLSILDGVTITEGVLSGCSQLSDSGIKLGIEHMKSSTNINTAFSECKKLTHIDLSGLKNVTTARAALANCTSLESVDISSFVNVKNATSMFYECKKLKDVVLPHTSNLINAGHMFFNCKNLESIDISGLGDLEIANDMFKKCEKLKTIKFPKSFSQLVNANKMFYGCKSLESIDLTSFGQADVNLSTDYMFSWCNNLKTVVLPTNIVIKKNTFLNCPSLNVITYLGTKDFFKKSLNVCPVNAIVKCTDGEINGI